MHRSWHADRNAPLSALPKSRTDILRAMQRVPPAIENMKPAQATMASNWKQEDDAHCVINQADPLPYLFFFPVAARRPQSTALAAEGTGSI
jgi:hypothetical protein